MKNQINTVNSLKFSTTKIAGNGETFKISIKLADECKNGHNDFSITGETYEPKKPLTDRYNITGGAIGKGIAKQFPEFAIFNTLHLCDVNGIPMHGVANGFYHLKNGFNSVKVNDENFKYKFCTYYRITFDQYKVLKTSETQNVFAYHLVKLGVFDFWKTQAQEAIKLLESLTGLKFHDNSAKNYETPLNSEETEKITIDIENGFYSLENVKFRNEEKRKNEGEAVLKKLNDDYLKTCDKAKNEFLVRQWQLKNKIPLVNSIWYGHSNQLCFNWVTYGYIHSEEEIKKYREILSNTKSLKMQQIIKGLVVKK